MSDLISRQAAIDIFDDYNISVENGELEAYSRDRKRLCELPSAQPMRKKGKWINHRNDLGHNIADCSKCGEAMQWFDPDTRPNYCPNCGSYNGGDAE